MLCGKITETAYGKINLTLDVVGRREDGYHLVCMVMQTVNIFDTVTIEASGREGGIRLHTDSSEIPDGEDNLVWKAADLMRHELGIKDELDITLTKRIPVAAGMAGGSTDAAAVMRGMVRLSGADISADRLKELGVTLGADIPYCIEGGTQLAEGIGEKLTGLENVPHAYLVIVKPGISVSTGWVYKAFDSIPAEDVVHPDTPAMLEAIRKGDIAGVAANLRNVLEQQTGAQYPVIGELERFLKSFGALGAMMTGSGPTVFSLFDRKEKAENAYHALTACYPDYQSFLTEFVNEA